MLERIHWPQQACDSDDEEDDPIPLEKISLVTGFLRKFIEEGNCENGASAEKRVSF